jgi:Tfp pilus assembly protein FimT
LDVLFVAATIAAVAAMAMPQMLAGIDRSRVVAAARYVMQQCGAARMLAIGRSANVAVRFRESGDDYDLQLFIDGNRNGVRTVDIEAGVDRPLGLAQSVAAQFPGARIGVAHGLGSDPVRVGRDGLLSFTPLGTATSGSVFVVGKDNTQFAVRVLGATARTRLERYEPATGKWIPQ